MTRAAIAGWGTAIPDQIVTNADLEQRVDTSDEWITTRTGIKERHVASGDETTATLAVTAGAAALKHAELTPDAIDLLILATATPDQPMPHSGAMVGETLGLRCGSFDLNTACSGFVYGLVTGASMLAQPQVQNVLLIGSDTLTRFVDPSDRTTTILFGDAAGAVVLTRAETAGLLAWDLGCDGSYAPLLEIPAGGSKEPPTTETLQQKRHYLHMAGQEVFRRAVRAVVESAQVTLQRANLSASDINWFVPHQANIRIITAACERIGIQLDRAVINLDRYGNTTAASIPVGLAEAADDGRIKNGDLVMLSGVGAGLTWGTAILEWGND